MPTKIEWTEETWNPITGCTKISEGCQNCYAERMSKRLAGRFGYPADDSFKPGTFHEDKLLEPLKWKKPRKVFVCSMSDIFHDAVTNDQVEQILEVIDDTPHHAYMFLTKRPENIREKLYGFTEKYPCRMLGGNDWLPNVWLGVTAENQRTADERIPILLQIPAAVRFVSVEPMLGPVDVGPYLPVYDYRYTCGYYKTLFKAAGIESDGKPKLVSPGLDWVICGGETGPGARPMQPEWAKSLLDQCVDAGVPFFFKQWGEWFVPVDYNACLTTPLKVGKKKAGRLLDGREWNEYPEVANAN